jgi:hypothetical protein
MTSIISANVHILKKLKNMTIRKSIFVYHVALNSEKAFFSQIKIINVYKQNFDLNLILFELIA